jgi:hypothetical protein
MSGKQRTILIVLGLMILCAAVALAALLGYSVWQPKGAQETAQGPARPTVQITSPQHGQQIPVGEVVMVHAVASGQPKIRRIEMWIDGQLVAAQDTTLPDGTSPFPLVTSWQPLAAGKHTLIARAFDMQGGQGQATVEVEATSAGDRDGDGIGDAVDACPDEAGVASADGCPDRDGDGIADGSDACPDEAGVPENSGCPLVVDGDRDGDGVPDEDDECPDEPGTGTGCPLIGDRDGDGIRDEEDACPDEVGTEVTDGCPDRDGDTTPDGEDECPDDPGPPESGCPAPTESDRDGDGFPDDEDECPDEPGVPATWGCPDRDGDGVRDSADECPDDPGPPENRGCPVEDGGGGPGGEEDSDGDGIPDGEDACPGAPGPAELEGCPDTDGDGVPDYRDMCPDEPGPPENLGCPEGTPDADGDGVPDADDPCPDEAGEPEDGGCPPPEDVEDGAVMPGSGEVEWPGMEELETTVEFQALSFQVGRDYDGVYCYPSLAGGPVERYAFEPLDAQQWDIAAELGSRTLATGLSQPIAVQVECGADNVYLGDGSGGGGGIGEGGGWGTYWNIGSIDLSHPPTDWDGHVITARSEGGSDGQWFEVQYRLCAGSCDDATFPAPVALLSHGRDDLLIWQWNGALHYLAYYDVYMNGSRIMRMAGSEEVSWMSVAGYEPLCGGRNEFYVVAVGEDGRESVRSNTPVWEADACPRVIRVTFEQIVTFDSGDQEHSCLGPIFGFFWVQGSEYESLRFEGDDYPDGFRLCPNSRYDVQEMFDTIWWWGSGMGGHSSPYWAPDSNSVTVELGPDDDFTLGGVIYEWDRAGTSYVYREAFNHSRPAMSGDMVRPGRYALQQGQIRIIFTIDVLVGPEVGAEPDLTITNVDKAGDQLRVHVFNNASDMPAPANITVHWVPVGSGTVVDSRTWENVQIPSGGSRILQSGEPVGDIGGMIFVLDPDENVPDGNRGNNTFETPLRMRVEFLQVGAPHCSESGCSIFDCDSEWTFSLWAGYGPSESDISWVAFHERFPRSGHLEACGHDACRYEESSAEDYIMEGDERYVFEFDMPASENVYVRVHATELDFWTSDDQFVSPLYRYASRENWGARADPYEGSLAAESDCNDALCTTCREGNVWARWRITKVD